MRCAVQGRSATKRTVKVDHEVSVAGAILAQGSRISPRVSLAGNMTCLEIWKNGGVEITTNDRRTSYVTFTDIEHLTEDDEKRPIDRKLAVPFEQSDT